MNHEEALALARVRFGPQLADSVHLERADFGWIARVEEVQAADGLIGHAVLAVGPQLAHARFYPAGPSARVRRSHLAWLDTCTPVATDPTVPPSFS